MDIPTFRPTMAEFADFEAYVTSIAERCTVGLARVVPPAEWTERVLAYSADKLTTAPGNIRVNMPVRQLIDTSRARKDGVFKVHNQVERQWIGFNGFTAQSDLMEQGSKVYLAHLNRSSFDACAQSFWKNLGRGMPAAYGADSDGSLFDPELNVWNLNRLPSILRVLNTPIPGVTNSYLYFGMWKSLFAAHTEDMELYSINFLHSGASKMWYAIPPSHASSYEALAEKLFPSDASACPDFLRHKQYLISPKKLQAHRVPYCQGAQRAGEFMITFPRGYHWGFNSGANVAEAVNFALPNWIEHAKHASACRCIRDSVHIDMEVFLFRYLAHLRSTGALAPPPPPSDPSVTWRFSCPCGMEATNLDPEILWPCKPQFECDHCHMWAHFECHGDTVLPDQSPAICYYCVKELQQAPQATSDEHTLSPAPKGQTRTDEAIEGPKKRRRRRNKLRNW